MTIFLFPNISPSIRNSKNSITEILKLYGIKVNKKEFLYDDDFIYVDVDESIEISAFISSDEYKLANIQLLQKKT